MSHEPVTVSRADWAAVVAAFHEFFAGKGVVRGDETMITFAADHDVVATGLTLTRAGVSTGYMPLHAVEAVWDQVTFDAGSGEVRITVEGVGYTYRVPPAISPHPG
jgi:hypothetical protein